MTEPKNYKLLGFKKNSTQAMIMISSTGKILKIRLDLLMSSEILDQLTQNEIKHIFRRFYSQDSVPTAYELNDRHETSWIVYSVLNLILAMLFVFTGLAATKLIYISWLDITVTAGLFLYPLTFLVVDILNESYGLKLARKAILFSFLGNTTIVMLLGMSALFPGLPNWSLDTAYGQIIQHVSSVLIASSVSFLVSEYVNSYLLCKIKELTNSRFLFLRVFLSTLFAVILDSFLFCFIAFYGTLDNSDILKMVYVQIAIKVILAFFNILPAYGARALFRRYISENRPI